MSETKNKQCPICGEYIPVESEICEFCGEKLISENIKEENTEEHDNSDEPNDIKDISDTNENEQKPKSKTKLIIYFSIVLVLGFLAVLFTLIKVNKGIDLSFNTQKEISKPKITKTVSKIKSSDKNIDIARELYKNKKTDEAAEIFQAEVDNNNNPIANYYMGEIYNNQGFRKIAISYYKSADAGKKDFYEPKKRLAQVYWEKDETDMALKYAESALKLKNNDVELLKTLALIYKEQDKDNKLLEIYPKIIKLEPKNYDANYYMANYYYKKGEYKTAAIYLSNILSDHYDTDIAYGLVVCYVKVEYYTKAIEILNKIIDNDSYEYYSATNLKRRVMDLRDGYNQAHGRYYSYDLEERVEDNLF